MIKFDSQFELFEHQYIGACIYGCTYDEYWNDDPRIYYWKEEAYEIRERYALERQDGTAWMTGLYVAEAIATTFSDKNHQHDYPSYPMLVETMDTALKEKRKLAELTKMRDQFLASSRHVPTANKNGIVKLGEPL
jgi:homoserine dehydrogenase